MEYEHVTHSFPPIYDSESQILILGSFPSVKSREQQFFYGHPQNRFWKVIAAVTGKPVPETIEEKKVFLKENHMALWDVIESCDIVGSSDSQIKNVAVNDLSLILKTAKIRAVFVNGGKAYELYRKYVEKETHVSAIKLPSTSPANAAFSQARLTKLWSEAIHPFMGEE